MNPNDVAPMVVGVVFFVMSGAVLLLRPIATRLGKVLEVVAEEKRRQLTQTPMNRDDAARIATLLENMDRRLTQIEDRQEFTDKLLSSRTKGEV